MRWFILKLVFVHESSSNAIRLAECALKPLSILDASFPGNKKRRQNSLGTYSILAIDVNRPRFGCLREFNSGNSFVCQLKKSEINSKMNKFLVLAVLCIASASCVELENLCSSDSFDYKGVQVNAFYRVQQNITFGSLRYYLIDDTIKCDPSEFFNKTNPLKALNMKNK